MISTNIIKIRHKIRHRIRHSVLL